MKSNDEILIERAKLLAVRGRDDRQEAGEELTGLEFLLTPERYAIACHLVHEVLLLKELTPIPGAPAFVAGITNLRGKIISVIDLKIFFHMTTKGITELNKVILLSRQNMEFGILTDAIIGTYNIGVHSLGAPPAHLQDAFAGYVKGLTESGLIVLNGESIMTAKSIVVNQK
jgi:purine-binding chemotaxis protein CheW